MKKEEEEEKDPCNPTMKAQEKTDVDGDAMLLISKDRYPDPGSSSCDFYEAESGVDDLDYGACIINNEYNRIQQNTAKQAQQNKHSIMADGLTWQTIGAEAQCRCHLSYSCDYRTVDVRWKTLTLLTPRNNQNNCVCPPSNCCHWHCSCSHEELSAGGGTGRVGRRKSSLISSPSSPSSSSSSSSSSLVSAIVDEVEVDNTCMRDQCQQCCSAEEKNVLSYFCDLNWRRKKNRNSLDIEDFSMTATPIWKWEFTSRFHRFMARFSGRRRRPRRRALNSFSGYPWARMTSFLYVIFVVVTGCLHLHIADACSSRSTPKPRPPSPTLRPNITIQTYTCPLEYDAHYCLNNATCFTVKIGESILYNCECADGYMGQRCEFKDLEGSYLPSKQRAMLEQAGITSGVAIMVVFVIIVCFYLYVRSRRKSDFRRKSSGQDEVDTFVAPPRRPFSGLHSLTAGQHHHSSSCPPPCPSHPGGTMSSSGGFPVSPTTTTTTTTANVPTTIKSTTSNKSTVLPRETIVPNNQLCV